MNDSQSAVSTQEPETIKSSSWHSFPKVFALGHRAIDGILQSEDLIVEEKVDGSQISFGKFLDNEGNEFLKIKSKGAIINDLAPDNMFKNGVETIKLLMPMLTLGWTYRGEYLSKPKHNVLAYDRFPQGHIILFDVNDGEESYLDYDRVVEEGTRLGLEVVPLLHRGPVTDLEMFRTLLENTSILGGQKIEGVVVKNYSKFGIDGKVMMGKFVSELYKEVHGSDWKERNPQSKDILQILVERYRTPARWTKAVQHLRDAARLQDAPQDIGLLLPEVTKDTEEECRDEIKDKLFSWAWPHIRRGLTHGLPEWYKEQLLQRSFNGDSDKTAE